MSKKNTPDIKNSYNAPFAYERPACFSLREHIALRSDEELAALQKILGTEDIEGWLTCGENLRSVLLALPSADFELFIRAAGRAFMDDDGVLLAHHTCAMMFCLFSAFLSDGGIYIVVPSELKALWHDIDRLDFTAYKRRRDTLDFFAVAAAKLYGVIPMSELCEIFELRVGEKLSVSDAEKLLDGLSDGSAYVIEDGLLLHPAMPRARAQDYIQARAGIERYLPVRAKLEYLGQGDYYDVFHELEMLRLSAEQELGEQKAYAMADSLYMLLASELYGPFVRTDFFQSFGLPYDHELIESLKPKVRQWRLYGHTAEELRRPPE